MLRRRQLKALRDVAEVRVLQRLAAEMQAARQTGKLRTLEQDLGAETDRLGHLCAGWDRVVGAGALDPGLANGWAGAVDTGFARVAAKRGEVDDQTAVVLEASSAWRLAREQAKAAQARSRDAARQAADHRDERIFDEICERQVALGIAP